MNDASLAKLHDLLAGADPPDSEFEGLSEELWTLDEEEPPPDAGAMDELLAEFQSDPAGVTRAIGG